MRPIRTSAAITAVESRRDPLNRDQIADTDVRRGHFPDHGAMKGIDQALAEAGGDEGPCGWQAEFHCGLQSRSPEQLC